jgi:hypothetical protein
VDSKKYGFLKAVLGQDGAAALKKAADRLGGLEDAILPRAVLAWLSVAARNDYEGTIPGIDDSYLDFSKNQNGSYSGSIAMGEGVIPFYNATVFNLAASIALSLGAEQFSDDYKDMDLVKLGKSIDIMAKAKFVSNADELAKGAPGPAHLGTKDEVIQGPKGVPAPQTKQTAKGGKPIKAPKVAPRSAKLPQAKVPALKVKLPGAKAPSVAQKSFALSERAGQDGCDECGLPLIKNGSFVGCMCFKDMARHVTLSKNQGKTYISFGQAIDEDGIATILESLGVSHGEG